MKRYILLVLCLIMLNIAYAQTFKEKVKAAGKGVLSFSTSLFFNQNVYKTKSDLIMEKVYFRTTKKPLYQDTIFRLKVPPSSGKGNFVRYRISKEDDDNMFIRLSPRVEFNVLSKDSVHINITGKNPPDAKNPVRYYFRVKKDSLLPHQRYLATQQIMGMPITLPVKFRKKDGNLRGEFEISLGYAFGYRVRTNNNPYSESYINIIPYGFSFNADKYSAKDAAEGTDEQDSFSLTYWASGLTYEYKKFNIGIFIGRDRMFNDRDDWVYQNKTWYSVGLGFKFGSDEE